MKRYSTTRQKLDKSGIRVYGTTYYPEIPVSDNDQFIYPQDGDRVDTLAHKYYGDVSLWWMIAQANHIGKGTMNINTGTKLRIPLAVEEILQEFES